MDESAIKCHESLELNDEERISTISVEGYETRFHQQYPLMLALRKHFASCGKMARIFVPRDKKGILKSPVLIHFWGEVARDKALKFSGSDMGGCTLVVKHVPQPEEPAGLNNHLLARQVRRLMVNIDGLPSSVRDIDVEIELCEHFSSCGEVTCITVFPTVVLVNGIYVRQRTAQISITGEGCVEKVQELSGRSNAQGWNIVVVSVVPLSVRKKRQHTVCENPLILFEEMEKAMKMEKAKMEKAKMEKAKYKMEKGKRNKQKTTE